MMTDKDNQEIMVSIICKTYNHEKYIRQCLDGFIHQITNFRYEILIHDDASNDGTASIIKEYERNYPKLIRAIYQKENQFSQKKMVIATFILPIAKGRYIALCEGDDYWCENNKLQLQYDALENNLNCNICLHRVKKIYENGKFSKINIPNQKISEGVIEQNNFLKLSLGTGFQQSSFFMRGKYFRKYFSELPDFRKVVPFGVGDMAYLLYFVNLGDAFFIDKILSCYRINSVGSWTFRMSKADRSIIIENKKKMSMMYEKFDVFSNQKFHDIVKKQLCAYEYEIKLLTNNYSDCLSKKYSHLVFKYGLRSGIYVIIKGVLQKIIKLFNYSHILIDKN